MLKMLLAALFALSGAAGASDQEKLQGRIREFSALMDELGPTGAELSDYREASARARRLMAQRKLKEAVKVYDRALSGLRRVRGGGARNGPLAQDWKWSERLEGPELAEPLPNEFALAANDRDYPLIAQFLESSGKRGFAVRRTKPEDAEALKKARIALVVGTPGAEDETGILLRKLLSESQLKTSGAYLLTNAFRPRQAVIALSGPRRLFDRLCAAYAESVYRRVEPPDERPHPRYAKLFSAVSEDGADWKEEGRELLAGASSPDLLAFEGGVRLYYLDGLIGSADSASSENGLSWRFERFQVRGLPEGALGVRDAGASRLDDGAVRLYFTDPNRPGRLFSALSSEGVSFSAEEGQRFAAPGLVRPRVVKMGEVYRLYYSPAAAGALLSAVSKDGASFKKERTLSLGSGDRAALFPVPGGWRMVFAREGALIAASSADGLEWKEEGPLPFQGRDPAALKLPDGRWRLYFVR